MINPQELRIGNTICYDPAYPNPTKILGVHADGVDTGARRLIKYDDIHPIPLTIDWLINFGFERYNDRFSIITVHGILTQRPSKLSIKYTSVGNMVVERPGNRTIYLHSVHQLQNLFYALCNRELIEIDDPNVG